MKCKDKTELKKCSSNTSLGYVSQTSSDFDAGTGRFSIPRYNNNKI